MKSKHEIPSKGDYMKSHSVNFILNEKTNTELEHEKNFGKVKKEFYTLAREVQENVISSSQRSSVNESIHPPLQMTSKKAVTDDCVTEEALDKVITESRTDYTGRFPKRYTTKCYMKLAPIPVWYTESILLHIGSTRRRYEEKIYFKNKLHPRNWSETMITEVPPKSSVSVAI